jgi:hypothetical protein
MKTSELIGTALDYAVAKCEGQNPRIVIVGSAVIVNNDGRQSPSYSTDYAQGGPIIEREGICVNTSNDPVLPRWIAYMGGAGNSYARYSLTPLAAAMRCYVASKLGEDIEIPEELIK